jgi:hypothetical protein
MQVQPASEHAWVRAPSPPAVASDTPELPNPPPVPKEPPELLAVPELPGPPPPDPSSPIEPSPPSPAKDEFFSADAQAPAAMTEASAGRTNALAPARNVRATRERRRGIEPVVLPV